MAELFHEFGIEWKLLLAQAVNFFILLFLLKKFVYGPVLKMVADRKRSIVKGLETAKAAEEKMKKIDEIKEAVVTEARRQELQIIQKAEERARDAEKEIMKEAHLKADGLLEDAQKRAGEEQAKSLEEVYKESVALVKSAMGKVFEKSPEQFENVLVEKSLKEL